MSSVALMLLLLQNIIFCGSAPSSNSMTVIRLFNAQPDNAHIGLRAPRRFCLSRLLSDKHTSRYSSSPHLYQLYRLTQDENYISVGMLNLSHFTTTFRVCQYFYAIFL